MSWFVQEENVKDKIVDGVESTVKWRHRFESVMNLSRSGASYIHIHSVKIRLLKIDHLNHVNIIISIIDKRKCELSIQIHQKKRKMAL